jgi:hypothetical protein
MGYQLFIFASFQSPIPLDVKTLPGAVIPQRQMQG